VADGSLGFHCLSRKRWPNQAGRYGSCLGAWDGPRQLRPAAFYPISFSDVTGKTPCSWFQGGLSCITLK
jgi:hypothetical protein